MKKKIFFKNKNWDLFTRFLIKKKDFDSKN